MGSALNHIQRPSLFSNTLVNNYKVAGAVCCHYRGRSWSEMAADVIMFWCGLDPNADNSAQKNKNPGGWAGKKHKTLRLQEKMTDQVKAQTTKLLHRDGSEPGLGVASMGAKWHTLAGGGAGSTGTGRGAGCAGTEAEMGSAEQGLRWAAREQRLRRTLGQSPVPGQTWLGCKERDLGSRDRGLSMRSSASQQLMPLCYLC